jgi:hypothetical protein
VTCNRSVDFSGYSNFRHKSTGSNWNIFESGVKHLTSNGQMMDQKYAVYNIKHLWVIMWHIFTSSNNTTTILFPTQFWALLYTYVIKQCTCTEKETTSLSIFFLLTIKLNYLHDLKIMFQCLLHLKYVHVGMAESWFLVWIENYNYSCVSESLNK